MNKIKQILGKTVDTLVPGYLRPEHKTTFQDNVQELRIAQRGTRRYLMIDLLHNKAFKETTGWGGFELTRLVC